MKTPSPLSGLLLLILGLISLAPARAAERVWVGADGANWTDAAVWTVDGLPATAPENADTVTISNGTAVALTSAALDDTSRFNLVQINGSSRGTLVVGPGGYLPTSQLKVGQEGTAPGVPGRLIVDGGFVSATNQQVIGYDSLNNPGRLEIINGGNYTSTAAFRVYGGTALVSNSTFNATFTSYLHGSTFTSVFEIVDSTVNMTAFAIGRDAQNASGKACRNVMRMRSGHFRSTADLEIGHTGTGSLVLTGAVEQTGGTVLSASGNVRLPITASAVGEYLLDGGLFAIHNAGDSFFLGGRDGSAKGFFRMTDGVFTNKGITQVGSYARGFGSVTVGGGRAVFEKHLSVGAVASSTGEVALTGGVLFLPGSAPNLNLGNASNAFGRAVISGGLLSGVGRTVNVGSASFGRGELVLHGGIVSNSSTVVGAVSSANGTLVISNGLWAIAGSLTVGQTNAVGRAELSGGVLTMTGASTFGNQYAGSGAFVMNGGVLTNAGFNIGNVLGSTGSAEFNGGVTYTTSDVNIGHGSLGKGAIATFTFTGGRLLTTGRLLVGSYGSGFATLSGGEIEALAVGRTDQSVVVGRDPGTFGQLTITGGALKGTNELVIGRDNNTSGIATGIVEVAGGDLYFHSIRRASGLHTFNLAGGTLHPYNRDPAFAFTATLTNDIGFGETGARFGLSPLDKDGVLRTVHATCTFRGNGGLAKRDGGTVTLGGTLAYTGDTVVEAGTLALSNAVASLASGVVEVRAGATLDVSVHRVTPSFLIPGGQTLRGEGSVKGPVRLASGAWLLGGPEGGPGVLTIDGDLTLDSGAELLLRQAGETFSRVHVTGNVTLPAAPRLTVAEGDPKAAQGVPFLTWDGSLILNGTRWVVTGDDAPLVVIDHGAKALTVSYLKGTLLRVL